ncbi:hypothetical protein GW17_00051797 [Ensete ventricosum]|nr:hypothetical protein GW17_00051797 [Ensete ventricosum]
MDAGSQRSALMPRSAGLLQFNAVHDGSLLGRGVVCCFLCWITVGRSAAMARRRHTALWKLPSPSLPPLSPPPPPLPTCSKEALFASAGTIYRNPYREFPKINNNPKNKIEYADEAEEIFVLEVPREEVPIELGGPPHVRVPRDHVVPHLIRFNLEGRGKQPRRRLAGLLRGPEAMGMDGAIAGNEAFVSGWTNG